MGPSGRGMENKLMKKKTKYTNEKIGKVEVIKDFLPKPEDLAFKQGNVKVIRDLLDSYSSHFSSKP